MSDKLNLKETALIMIDLQKGIAYPTRQTQPYSIDHLLKQNQLLCNKLKNTDALIVFVHVDNYGPEILQPITDAPTIIPTIPPGFSDFVLEQAYDASFNNVIHVKKHNWGAFYQTDLDAQLRRRGIKNIILTGIATTIGVDTTAREAYQHHYNLICVEDAMTDMDGQYHKDTVEKTFTKIARIKTTDQVLEML